MRQQELKKIREATWKVVNNTQDNRGLLKLEGLKLLAAIEGILVPSADSSWISDKARFELERTKRELADKVLERKRKRRLQNKIQYLNRKKKALDEANGTVNDTLENPLGEVDDGLEVSEGHLRASDSTSKALATESSTVRASHAS